MGSAIGMSSSFETDGLRALRAGSPWNRGSPGQRDGSRGHADDGGADQPAGGAGRDLVAEPSCVGDHGDKRHLQAMIYSFHDDHLPIRWLRGRTTTSRNLRAWICPVNHYDRRYFTHTA